MLLWHEKYDVKLRFQDLECPSSMPKQNIKGMVEYLDLACVNIEMCVHCKMEKCVCQTKPRSGFENYLDLKRLWKQQGMKTIRDFLIYYNLKDIDPFMEAVTNMQKFYIENNVDIFKDSISVPGVARQMLFQSEEAKFALFDSQNEDLYHKIKQGICGGPSIVYTSSMEKGQKLKGGDEICKNIFGFDANALYPYCLSQEMPCGTFVRRRESNLYKPEIQTKYLDIFVWMDKISEINNIRIMHRLNSGKEHYIMGYYVDGIWGMNVFSYLGCYHHACQECMQIWKCNKSEAWVKQQQVKYDRTCTRREYLESLGYRVHEIWECQFKKCLIQMLTISDRDIYLVITTNTDTLYAKRGY